MSGLRGYGVEQIDIAPGAAPVAAIDGSGPCVDAQKKNVRENPAGEELVAAVVWVARVLHVIGAMLGQTTAELEKHFQSAAVWPEMPMKTNCNGNGMQKIAHTGGITPDLEGSDKALTLKTHGHISAQWVGHVPQGTLNRVNFHC